MRRASIQLILVLLAGCSVASSPPSDRAAIHETSVRYMAASICAEPGYPCAVIFIRIGSGDPDLDLLDRLRDLHARGASRAEYFSEHLGDVWQRTREQGTGKRGEVLTIEEIRVESHDLARVSVHYGGTSSVLQLARIGGKWIVTGEDLLSLTVA